MTSRALRRCAAFAASTASLAIAAVAPTTAQAGTYELHQCADPAGVHAPIVAEWSASKGDIDNNCTAGGPLHVRFTNTFSLQNGETGGLVLDVPSSAPATRISAFRAAITTNPTAGSNSHLAGRLGTELLVEAADAGVPGRDVARRTAGGRIPSASGGSPRPHGEHAGDRGRSAGRRVQSAPVRRPPARDGAVRL